MCLLRSQNNNEALALEAHRNIIIINLENYFRRRLFFGTGMSSFLF
jgi:hypothetical protein